MSFSTVLQSYQDSGKVIMKGSMLEVTFEPGHDKICFMPYTNNKGTDQPSHPRNLISTFVVRCLDSKTPLFAIAEISRP